MAHLTYGTPEFYEEQFSDLLADVEAGNPEIADNIVKGFFLALDSWFNYHQEQADAYDQLRKRVREALAV
jgi:hypothetical protein